MVGLKDLSLAEEIDQRTKAGFRSRMRKGVGWGRSGVPPAVGLVGALEAVDLAFEPLNPSSVAESSDGMVRDNTVWIKDFKEVGQDIAAEWASCCDNAPRERL